MQDMGQKRAGVVLSTTTSEKEYRLSQISFLLNPLPQKKNFNRKIYNFRPAVLISLFYYWYLTWYACIIFCYLNNGIFPLSLGEKSFTSGSCRL